MSAQGPRVRLPFLCLVVVGLLVGGGLVKATWQYQYLSCAFTNCVEQPQIEYDVWWSPVNLSTWASVHSCADERVLSGVVTRSAPNGCWLQHHVRLWSEDLAQEHLFIFGNVDGGEATGQQLFCDGNDIVDDYSSVC